MKISYLSVVKSYFEKSFLIIFKEIIFVIGAISTIDPEGPHQALNKVLVSQIRCSVVSLSAEVKIWKDLTEISGGCYYVPLDVPSVSEKLEILARPPKGKLDRCLTD